MKMRITKKRLIAITIMAGFIISNYCYAGAWTLQEGKLYDKVSLNHYTADPDFTDTNLGNYIEYGLTDTVSLINSIYYKQISNTFTVSGTTTTTTTTGISDIEIGLKHKLAEGPSGIFSHQVLVKIPGAYDKNSILPLGNGQIDVEYRILYGLSLWRWFPGYANFEAGYRYRAEAPADEFRYLAEIGTDITNQLYARAKLDGIRSMKNAGSTTNLGGNPTTEYQFDLLKLDTALGYKMTDAWGLEFGYTPTLSARNTAKGTTYSLGFTYLLK
jgi:hypothetical protein